MNLPDHPRIAGIAQALFWIALAYALFMAFSPQPPRLAIDALGDKFEHMLAFGTLTFLAQLGFRRSPRWRIAERLSFVGALVEVIQSMPALHRDCDIRDWIADTVIIVIVTAFFVISDRVRA
jgi:VanZ family protein